MVEALRPEPRSRKECAEAIEAAVATFKAGRVGLADAEAVCRAAAAEGKIAEAVWREPLEAAYEEMVAADLAKARSAEPEREPELEDLAEPAESNQPEESEPDPNYLESEPDHFEPEPEREPPTEPLPQLPFEGRWA